MRLSTRLTAAMVALVLVTAMVIGSLTYRNVAEHALPRALDRADMRARLLAIELEASVRGARADVLGFRASNAVIDIMTARLASGIDPTAGATEAEWRRRLALRFEAEMAVKPNYHEFRIVGLDDGGREIVRVDRSGPGGAVRTVPHAELQRKGDRESLKETVSLRAGEVYVSRIDLNRDNGAIETPHVPVLRVATPLHAPDGRPFGIVIINVDMRQAFAAIRSVERDGGHIYVVNDLGDYLVHPDRQREFGFEFGSPARVQDDFPEFAEILARDDTAPRVVRDHAGARFGVGWETVRPAGGPSITVIEATPYAWLTAATTAIRNASLLGGLAAVLGGFVLAIILARSLTRPLVQMTRAVEGFARDEPMAVPTAASGEIGVLARAFTRMADDVREKAAVLKRALDERGLADEKFRLAVEASPNGVVMVDATGAIVLINAETERLFGYRRDELIGQSVDILVPEDLRLGHRLRRADFAAEPETRRMGAGRDFFGRRKNGTDFPVEIRLNPIQTQHGLLIMSVIVDITESRKAQNALLESERRLLQSQKMESVGQLTGRVAHDFNNILTVITGTIDILSEAVHDKPELAAITKLISEAADRGAELTGQLLAFARKQPLQPSETDVNGLIANAQKLFRPALGETIEIEALLAEGAWPALVDPTQLSTALLNLAVNARDAMPGGGKLTFETGNVFLDQSYADSNAEVQPGDYLMIAVSDTGTGIPPAIRDKVFEPFFSTKAAGKGTGLGLSMVYGFVRQSGGHIKIYSEVGYGTTIRVYLPRAGGQPQQAAVTGTASTLEGGSETVLLVEDDAMVRRSVTRQLQSIGYRTISTAGAAEALAVVDGGAAFDLLFTDVIMSGTMNGRQLANEVAKRRPGVNVLFTSGYTENAIVHHGRLDAGVLLLGKPYRKSELARMIRTAIDAPLSVAGGRLGAGGTRVG